MRNFFPHPHPRPLRGSLVRPLLALGLAAAIAAGFALPGPAEATTLERMSLEKLAATNSKVVVGQVVDAFSYWNGDGTFILTDVVIVEDAVLQGRPSKQKRTRFTLMGGQVGELQTVILGGPNLEIGGSYVFFLSESDLPGAPAALTVRDHGQGVFDLVESADGGLRAISQADSGHLVPDEKGISTVPGGEEGLSLDALIQIVDEVGAAKNGREVK